MPVPDDTLSPLTGWNRAHLAALADHLLLSLRPFASPGHGRITPPGTPGGYGREVDGLEGFARSFLLAAFRLAGEGGDDPLGLAQWYAAGVAEGTDPTSPHRWVRPDEHPQAKVEAASLALALDMTRGWIWEQLPALTQRRVIDYLAPVVGDRTYPRNNWLWFRVCVETFLRSVGGPWRMDDIASDLALHDSFARPGGWFADGVGRNFDHYCGWALQLYPTLWQRMVGADDLSSPARRELGRARLDSFLQDATHLIGADGGPLIQGRSLIYRFASAAPFWAGVLAGVPHLRPGLLRRAACGIVKHFFDRGVPDARGLLTRGWFDEYLPLTQSYSGPGSPYWAVKGLLGLMLPREHAVWAATEEPLPVERGDFVRAIEAPGWVASGTRDDGVVAVANHGTDHATPGQVVGDSPLYAGLGYSTADCPFVDDAAYREPRRQYVALVDVHGRLTHRAGFRTLAVGIDGDVGYAASSWSAYWLTMNAQQRRHGDGFVGAPELAGQLTVISLLRGPWECRLTYCDALAPQVTALQVAGGARGIVLGVGPSSTSGTARVTTGNPLGDPSLVPFLIFPARNGEWSVSLLCRSSAERPTTRPQVTIACLDDGWNFTVTWPSSGTTVTGVHWSGHDPRSANQKEQQ